jgi:hypothetical protein
MLNRVILEKCRCPGSLALGEWMSVGRECCVGSIWRYMRNASFFEMHTDGRVEDLAVCFVVYGIDTITDSGLELSSCAVCETLRCRLCYSSGLSQRTVPGFVSSTQLGIGTF